MGSVIPNNFSPLDVEYPTNGEWTIYGRSGPSIYAQPHFITYPLFVPICVQGDILIHIGIEGIPDGFIKDSTYIKSKFYKRLLKILTNISRDPGYPFTREYKSVPFNDSHVGIKWSSQGSCKGIESDIYWGSGFETETRSVAVLKNMWDFGREDCRMELQTGTGVPEVMALEELSVRAWLHDTVALVSVEREGVEGVYAFKTNNSPQGLYQEIYTLLSIPLHPNIIERPYYLITKQTTHSMLYPLDPASRYFMEPTQPIIGFLTPYYSGGSLKSYIKNHTITLKQQAKWALQLTSALLHIFEYGGTNGRCGRYSALKMDNIVIDSTKNLRLIDFELAGTWVQYTPIEVMSTTKGVGWIYHFSRWVNAPSTAPDPIVKCTICTPHPCTGTTKSERDAIHEKVLDYKFSKTNILNPSRPNSDGYYKGPTHHKEIPFWTRATDMECEAAMVWMLGCCLWCLLEEVPCLSELGSEWFPVGSNLWRRVREDVPVVVLDIVRKTLRTYVDRPKLREVYEVLKEWEGVVVECQM